MSRSPLLRREEKDVGEKLKYFSRNSAKSALSYMIIKETYKPS